MGRGCCETYGEDIPHDHEDEDFSEVEDEILTPPQLPVEITKTVITPGAGSYPRKGDEVRVHYTGWLQADGSKFDSSVDRGQLFTFVLGQGRVIKGWDLGVATMQKGEKARFVLPAEYAYGATGSPPKIPGGATLEFEIELFSFGSDKDLFQDGRVLYRYVRKSRDWKTPREGDEVEFEVTTENPSATTTHRHTLNNKSSHPEISSEILDALLAELKPGDCVALTLREDEAKKNGNLNNFRVTLKKIFKVDDVSLSPGDKRVFKKILTPGEGYKNPETGAEVTLAVEVSNAEGFVLLSQDSVKFVIGNCVHSELLEAAVAKMTLNETALVWASATSTETATQIVQDSVLQYPVEHGLQFRVTLKAFDEETKAFYALDKDEKLKLAETIKETGSRVLKDGRTYLAAEKYKQALKIFEHKDNDTSEVKTLLKACRLNLAMCYLKLGNFRKVIEEADKILKEDALNVKALYRKALAHHKLADHLDAQDALKRLIEVDGENVEAKQLLVSVKDAIKKDNDKQKGLFAKMFKAVSSNSSN